MGFGTIVGSAVFNVLFVIGCCAMFTPVSQTSGESVELTERNGCRLHPPARPTLDTHDNPSLPHPLYLQPEFAPLKLTWWPLFRDCSYYIITLASLAWVMNDQRIEIWEAGFQFSLYFGYVR